jgi:hypothetical protein
MFDFINGIFAIRAEALYKDLDVISYSNYKQKCWKEKIKVLVNGHRGQQAWVEYASLERCGLSDLVEAKLGYKPREVHTYNAIIPILSHDPQAEKYFADYRYGEFNNKSLSLPTQAEYTANAIILNAIHQVATSRLSIHRGMSGRTSLLAIMTEMHTAIKGIDRQAYKHTLNYDNPRSLERVYKNYKSEGYYSLVHKNFGNKSALKVTEKIEKLLLGIYCMETKPYQTGVLNTYLMFLAGKQPIVDKETGEYLNPADYFDEKGNPITISEGTANNWLKKKWENENASTKMRNAELYWVAKNRPHNHRHAPVYSLSKLTMDDIAIPFKRPDGTRVWAYQIFDTQSTAVVGRAYAVDKSVNLLVDALKDFMYLCVRNGWGIPGQIECEQHLANTMTGYTDEDGNFEADLLTAGTLFTNVSFCRGGMPISKRAEGMIKQKKYQVQAKREGFLRRPFARLEANILNTDKNPKRYTVKNIIKNEEADCTTYNDSLHPDQELYPNKTRWEVLIENVNPNLPQPQLPVLAYHIGEVNKMTQIHNSQWVEVATQRFMLPSPKVMKTLRGTTVQAHYFPGNEVKEVYLYQDKRYICTCLPLQKYNEAIIERTEEDLLIKTNQDKYTAQFDKITREKTKSVPKLFTEPIERISEKLENETAGTTPIHGEYDEPDMEVQRTEVKEHRKAERDRKRINEEIERKHLEYLTINADLAQYD